MRRVKLNYVPLLLLAMVFMFARSLVAAKLLNITEFGAFSFGLLVSNSFCMFGGFGFYLLLQRDLPMLIATGLQARGSLIFHQTLIFSVVGLIACLPLVFLDSLKVSPTFTVISLLNGLAQQVFLVVTLQSRSEERTIRFAVENLLRSALVFAVIVWCGWYFRTAFSMLLAETLVTLGVAVWIYAAMVETGSAGYKALWVEAAKDFSSVKWKTPLTLMTSAIIGFVLFNADRWIAASYLSSASFAVYAFAGNVLIAAQAIQSVINASVFPMLARTYALDGSSAAAVKSIRYTVITLAAAILFSLPAFVLASYVIEDFFPAYVLPWELLSLFFLIASVRVSDFLSNFLIISGQERLLLGVNVCSAIAASVIWFGGSGIEVAGVHAVSIALFATIVSVFNYAGCFIYVGLKSRA